MTAPAVRPLRVVLLGPPASGKGTQGRRLAQGLGLAYLSTGALLREQMEQGTELGKKAEPILARGGYLPDELMLPILAEWLDRQNDGWVLDGFPRSLPQAKFLDATLAGRGSELDAVVSLEAPFSVLLSRIRDRVECADCRWTGQGEQLADTGKCPVCEGAAGPRADDSEENFRSRHSEFISLTQPVIDHYRKLGHLIPCDATAPQDDVAARLLDAILPSRLDTPD
ncbi:nucleoside monophosphate kinase [Luteolibacter yonseiensis]|uniref:Adenylate kinase n=1 Tax=Luteolibacter yonseiensis TaxID=1144680 RepID=A0A934VBK5_9BACT|nr:nucleoside monophosphate kinase [Luteolibacter yonseiensis]MBK1816230.1 nucleoside monophosphate kinase [Luteolibacter yonseiensis]